MEGTPCCLPLLVLSGASIGTDTARMNDDSAGVDGKAFASGRICLSSPLSLMESLLGEASLEVSREPFIGERSMMRKVTPNVCHRVQSLIAWHRTGWWERLSPFPILCQLCFKLLRTLLSVNHGVPLGEREVLSRTVWDMGSHTYPPWQDRLGEQRALTGVTTLSWKYGCKMTQGWLVTKGKGQGEWIIPSSFP